jgi:hypothetical protein
MGHLDNSGLSACQQFISVLEAQLRTANQLRDQLENHEILPAAMPAACERLVEKAVETARAAAMLRDQLCRPPVNRYATKAYTRGQ